MALSLIILPALLGYWFLNRCHVTRFYIERQSGYHLAFNSAIAGLLLLVAGYPLVLGVTALCPRLAALWIGKIPFEHWGTAVSACLFAEIFAWITNRRLDEENAARMNASLHGDLIELRLGEAMERSAHVELSLRSGKSYVGMVLNSGITTGEESDVSLIPTVSGYRNEGTRELVFTTFYGAVFDDWLSNRGSAMDHRTAEEIADYFTIVIPKSEIVSVRLFDMKMYGLFEKARTSPG